MTAPSPRFAAMIWTNDPQGEPVTVAVTEGQVRDVAAYALPGEHADAHAWAEITAHGEKLTERQARQLGAGWPAFLTYRR
jgi:hypothetical protein